MKRIHISALLSALASSASASSVIYGDPLIDRPSNDAASGSIFVQPQPLFPGTITNWSYFDNENTGSNVTPLILERTAANTFTVRGIGTTRTSAGSGVQSFGFGLVSGSNAVGSNFYVGWKDGTPSSDNTGVIDFDNSLHRVRWLGPVHTNISTGYTAGVSLELGRAYSLDFTLNTNGTVLGDAPHSREFSDSASGSIFALNDTAPVGQMLSMWNLFDAGDAGQSITPLLLENVAGNYVVRGIGTTRVSNGEGGQVFDFGLVGGSAVAGANYVMGFKDGGNGFDNDGVIDFDNNAGDNVLWFGQQTNFSPGSGLGGGQALGRSYSIQGLFVPEPGTMALASLAAAALLLRRRA